MQLKTILYIFLITLTLIAAVDTTLKPFFPPAYIATKYGWTTQQGVQLLRIQDTTGHYRDIKATYYNDGFKRWGDLETKRTKMLILGDSFTEMRWVHNEEEWYAYLEKAFRKLELFVYGGSGYGTVQEFLILHDYIDIIDPDIILWQFTSNDYWNNVYEVDRATYPFNNYGFRPYLESGVINYRMPMPYETLRQYSVFADQFLKMYDLRMASEAKALSSLPPDEYRKALAEKYRKAQQAQKTYRAQAVKTTRDIFSLVKKRAGNVPVYLFSADRLDKDMISICKILDIVCIPNIGGAVLDETQKGKELRVHNNRHWNRAGNALVGKKLVEYFQANYSMRF